MGWLDLEAGAFNKEVIGADLATLPAEITANISDESVGTCAEQALEVYGNHPYVYIFPVWLRKRLIYAGSEPVPNHTEKSDYSQFSTNIKKKLCYVSPGLQHLGSIKIFTLVGCHN